MTALRTQISHGCIHEQDGHKCDLLYKFYIHGSMQRDSLLIRSNKMQQYAGIYLLQVYSTYFRRPLRPSSEAQKIVTAASGTSHITYLSKDLAPTWPN